jgi:hypothetical protein
MNETLLLITLLFTKHFIVDFLLQGPYQYKNKGTYLHGGGILHAGLHGWFTALICYWFVPQVCFTLGLIDAIIHYHIDWIKMKINKHMGWGSNTHEQFWWLLGLDQYLHALTYIGLILLVTK